MNETALQTPRDRMRRTGLLWALAIVAAVLLSRLPVLDGGLIYDDDNLLHKSSVATPTRAWPRIFSEPYFTGRNYRPLTTLSLWAQRQVSGERSNPYRRANVLLHAVNAVLLFLLARRVSGDAHLAGAAALLYAVHPIHTEALSGLLGRGDLLSTAFILAAGWLAWVRPAGRAGRAWRWFALAGLLALALATKETGVVIVVLVPLARGLSDPTAGTQSPREAARRVGRSLCEEWGFFALAAPVLAVYGLARAGALGGVALGEGQALNPVLNPLGALGGTERLAGCFKAAALNLWHLLWPVTLSPDYSFDAISYEQGLADPWAWAGLGAVAAIVGAAVWLWLRRGRRDAAFFLVLGLMAWLPVSNLIVPVGMALADRFLYLPSAALLYGAAAALLWLGRRLVKGPARRRAGTAALGAACVLYAAQSWQLGRIWSDNRRLLETAVEHYPRCALLQFKLGNAWLEEDPGRALHHYRRAQSVVPESQHTLFNVGLALNNLERWDEAVEALERGLLLSNDPEAFLPQLARAYEGSGRTRDALRAWMAYGKVAPGGAARAEANVARLRRRLADR